MGIQPAGHPGKECGQGEGEHLVIRGGDTGGLGGHFVFADGDNGPAMAGAAQGEQPGHHQHHDDIHIAEIRHPLDADQAHGAAGEGKVIENHADNFAKAQRDNGQIIALEPQGGHADNNAEHRSHQPAAQQAHGEGGCHGQRQVFGHQGRGIRADGHEPRMAQSQLAQEAGGQVQGDGHDHGDADVHEGAAVAPGENAGINQQGNHQINAHDGDQIQDIRPRSLIHSAPPHTFSLVFLPSSPAGFTSSTTIRMPYTTASAREEEI